MYSCIFLEVWFCSEECEYGGDGTDGVLEYSKQVIYRGLCHLANRDFIREGDGPKMVAMWILAMPDY